MLLFAKYMYISIYEHNFMKREFEKIKMTVKVYGAPGPQSVAVKSYGPPKMTPPNSGLDPPLYSEHFLEIHKLG